MATKHHSSATHHRDAVAVVMVPLPAQGHLNQLLHLTCLVSARNLPVHFASTAAHIRQAKLRLHGWAPLSTTNPITFHELPIPTFQSPNPNPNASNKFPSHLQPLFDAATTHLRRPLAELLRSLADTSRRVVVVHDSMMSSVVQDVVDIENAESYIFHSVSAFAIFLYFQESLGTRFPDEMEMEGEKNIPSLDDCFTSEFMEFIVSEQKYIGLTSGSLYNTCRVVEGKYMDLIEKMSEDENKKHWAIGPFNPILLTEKKPDGPTHECLKWLDKQPPKSVILVSFGTTTSLPDEQIKELANGLERSAIKFIWILRDADRGNLNASDHNETRKHQLPDGFEERVKERGMIVRDWAPQLEILGHPATGGFLSHCGWNSCMESMSMGVPIAAWPMHSDQPRNAFLMTRVLGNGLVVKDWAERGEVVGSLKISGALRRLMGSAEIRRRTEELGGGVRRAVAEGGVTRLEMDSFIAHICR